MKLDEQQRALLKMICYNNKDSIGDDPYLNMLNKSQYIDITQEVVQWWKSYRIERYCPLTSELLKQLHIFEQHIQAFSFPNINLHYIENIGITFLSYMSSNKSPLISSVAQFEHALISVKKGDNKDYIIYWNQDPGPVINSLISASPIPENGDTSHHIIIVSGSLPDTFKVLKKDHKDTHPKNTAS